MSNGNINLSKIVRPLIDWYRINARDLPWRKIPEPYRVWVSEIMLQQTRVEAVKPYYERFLTALPTVACLAAAPEEQLLKLWEGLGYYSRVRNMQKAARMIMEEYGGVLPGTYQELLRLPGIGSYTAGAIASIAFGEPVPVVDGNVLRVISRITASREDIGLAATRKAMEARLMDVVPVDCPGDFNQAVMELGATICLPNGKPLCLDCPLWGLCLARREGRTGEIPVKAPKSPRRVEKKTVLVLVDELGRVALRKRPGRGLLAGLWELPALEGNLDEKSIAKALADWGLTAGQAVFLGPAKHIFTHVEWRMTGYRVPVHGAGRGLAWVTKEQLEEEYALPSAFRAYRQALEVP
ncbi:A/G-specific adenine glycosylase [Christensenella sp. MSJ-20]|uniref:A/G-specific adenine glycosylase n=1 Tax=Christensenella sp. MSJ-20 TaxID=2841518 RepID=UPI001C740252|nr:A/G-specific adenine glycosylase [Christensenella sp. MSJ-20]